MNGTYGTTTALQVTGSRLIDDLLRRELRVGDPRNAQEVAKALRGRYAADAARLDQEMTGLPLRYDLQPALLSAPMPAVDTAATKEERRVQGNLESDLAALIDSRDNREWSPEIRGWRDVLTRELAAGAAAARLAQDPAMRDRGFLAVRKFGEYARVARLVGVLSLPLNCDYRRLATTLDEAASVVRILMGEALFNAGLAEGGMIIQVPMFELRDRRDALVLAVRRLSGTAVATDNFDWGDALAAYRLLLTALQQRGAQDLRVYLRADLLSAILDGLISELARQDPDSLRQVAATSPVEIARMRRLSEIATDLMLSTSAPPVVAALTFYAQTLRLFLDGFNDQHGGARLIDLAMPLPLAAQQSDEADREGRRALRQLVNLRGEFAQEVECYLSCCGCHHDDLRCQVQLDKVLYDVDRAIDLYAQGGGIPPTWGVEERRAAVYGIVARNLTTSSACVSSGAVFDVLLEMGRTSVDLIEGVNLLTGKAVNIATAEYLRRALAAAQAGNTSNSSAEIVRRGVFDVPAVIEVPVGQAQQRLGAIAIQARTSPLGIDEGIKVLIDTIELAIGITLTTPDVPLADPSIVGSPTPFVVSILAVGRSPGWFGFDLTGHELTSATAPTVFHVMARDVLSAARVLLRFAMRAIGDPLPANAAANRQALRLNANVLAGVLGSAAALNLSAATSTQRLMLAGAVDAASKVAEVASRIGTLQAGEPIEPVALGRAITDIANVLQAVPTSGEIIDTVFDEQVRCELDWRSLVESLAPRCLGSGQSDLLDAGLELLHASPRRSRRPTPEPPVVPDMRVSLKDIATKIDLALVNVPHPGTSTVPSQTLLPTGAPAAPDLREFARRLRLVTSSRGELRSAIKQDPTIQQDWDAIQLAYPRGSFGPSDEFHDVLENLFDSSKPSRITPSERKRLEDLLDKLMFPYTA